MTRLNIINNRGEGTVTVNLLNPKSPAPEATKAEGFGNQEEVVVIGDEEAQIILEAALTSNLVLTSVLNSCFSAKKPKEEK
ncbi:hypothetical protein IFM89_009939 [Coptis chinensis]|uniref:Uncharacterized protein n=1 Tax=Coptis chinensis TaxID=261450 RepID=A0A835LMJ7_9MAGN|nr:hypothetical protein IFM89_009939 [Coptis chinensis]